MVKILIYRCTNCHTTVKSTVELEECPHCGFDAHWDTWNKIQITETNEKEEKVIGWQDKVIEPRRKMIRKDIIKKVEKLEKEERYIQRCLNAKVCPDCGRDISFENSIHMSFHCECGFNK